MWIATIVLSVLLAATFLASFARKVGRASSSMQLRDRLAVAPWLWQSIGLAELAGGLGLLVGLGLPPLGVAAAVGAALLMIGAVVAHLRRGISGGH
jgi:hypothetical protein